MTVLCVWIGLERVIGVRASIVSLYCCIFAYLYICLFVYLYICILNIRTVLCVWIGLERVIGVRAVYCFKIESFNCPA